MFYVLSTFREIRTHCLHEASALTKAGSCDICPGLRPRLYVMGSSHWNGQTTQGALSLFPNDSIHGILQKNSRFRGCLKAPPVDSNALAHELLSMFGASDHFILGKRGTGTSVFAFKRELALRSRSPIMASIQESAGLRKPAEGVWPCGNLQLSQSQQARAPPLGWMSICRVAHRAQRERRE